MVAATLTFGKLGWLNFFVAFFKPFTGNAPGENHENGCFTIRSHIC